MVLHAQQVGPAAAADWLHTCSRCCLQNFHVCMPSSEFHWRTAMHTRRVGPTMARCAKAGRQGVAWLGGTFFARAAAGLQPAGARLPSIRERSLCPHLSGYVHARALPTIRAPLGPNRGTKRVFSGLRPGYGAAVVYLGYRRTRSDRCSPPHPQRTAQIVEWQQTSSDALNSSVTVWIDRTDSVGWPAPRLSWQAPKRCATRA